MTNEAQVKRFTAPSMTRALELVRDEMGPEAVILSSRKIKGGVEILISSEPDHATRGIPERRAFGQNFDTDLDRALDSDMSWQSQAGIERAAAEYSAKVESNARGADDAQQQQKQDGLAEAIERAREKMFDAKRNALASQQGSINSERSSADNKPRPDQNLGDTVAANSAPANRDETHTKQHHSPSPGADEENERKLEMLRGELADLRMLLEEQAWKRHEMVAATQATEPVSEHLNTLNAHLSRLGITSALVHELCEGINQQSRISEAWQQSLSQLAEKIDIATHIDTKKGGVFAFIGPTGVGKTTTLAKLAARYTMAHGPGKVALVSMDTHRVGAVEQLRALGRILDVPVRTINGSQSLMTTLASLRHFPLILIDTAGFRHGDARLKSQLSQLDDNPQVKRLLVLSSLSQLQTLKASIHAYQPRQNIDACVISKLDEATSLGEAISALIEHQLGVAYVTDGQEIPRDIQQANSRNLVANAVSIAKRMTHQEPASM